MSSHFPNEEIKAQKSHNWFGLHYSMIWIFALLITGSTPRLWHERLSWSLGSLLTAGPDECTDPGLGDCRIGISISMSHYSLVLHIVQVLGSPSSASTSAQTLLSLMKSEHEGPTKLSNPGASCQVRTFKAATLLSSWRTHSLDRQVWACYLFPISNPSPFA
jgi:hypothetical protein